MTHTSKIEIKLFFLALGILASCSTPEKQATDEGHDMPGMVMISDNDRLLANIKTETADIKTISETTTLVGKSTLDERQVEILTSRVKGRLDKLLVRNPGEYVSKGQEVYSIYSEELLAEENDYLIALDQYEKATTQKVIAAELLTAAKKKLTLWTLTEDQIKTLGQSRQITPLIKFYSPYSGYLIDLSVKEGEYVDVGSPILKLSNMNTLWIETQVYTDEVKYFKQNPSLEIEFEAYPDETFKGAVVFDNPILENDQKINLVRVQVQNVNHKIKPGMMAYIYLKRNEKKALVIPKSALLMESAISVWIEEDGMFEPRRVTIGIENKREVEILSGLRQGDKVVVSGAFFLKSENVIQQGGGDMGGMKM